MTDPYNRYIILNVDKENGGKNMLIDIWYNPLVSDEDIEKCDGDYIGCEICIHKINCKNMRMVKLSQLIDDENDF